MKKKELLKILDKIIVKLEEEEPDKAYNMLINLHIDLEGE